VSSPLRSRHFRQRDIVPAERRRIWNLGDGGTARDGDGLFWEINGTEGDIRISGPSGHTQMVQLSLKGARGKEWAFRPLEVPASYRSGWPEDVEPGNVARLYARMARDLREGTRSAPTFEDAVAVHRVIAAIEREQPKAEVAPSRCDPGPGGPGGPGCRRDR
jgi:predicted dehydrogenase